ncbi:hypothetical protein GCM10010156_58720 [Planobispora rosea]|uniref:Uncharacterized protein n=1 Tax=Planobispora rosea TaxID=35762 RepID=A0A8J3WFB8_PLARO|nr:hypothetical protein [Planobispora rosea]GGS92717.1 hypothetical protein GCM10010156_58720 [Planobispora rosea]GIH87230.1 hypothetical protein Pro02_56380 [Planobispora rosea]
MLGLTSPDTFRRRAAGVSLVLAPLCLLLGMIVDPLTAGADETLGYAQNPVATGISATLLHYAWVLWVPGVIGLVHLVRGKGVVLANVAGAVTVLGLINFSSLMIADFFDIVLYRRLPEEQATTILQEAAQPAMVIAWQVPGMIGSLSGLIAVAVAYARAGHAGWWFPAGVPVGMVVWIAGTRAGIPLLAYTGPAILLLVFGIVGTAMIRMTDEQWRPARPPVPAGDRSVPGRTRGQLSMEDMSG